MKKYFQKLLYRILEILRRDSVGIKGYARLQCFRADGTLKWDTGLLRNTIAVTGKAQIALLAGDASATPFTYLAVGTSSAAESNAHTALQAEISTGGLARAAATVSRTTTTTSNDTLRLTYTWTASAGHTVEEIGVFNANSSGTMLGRKLTGTKTVNNGEYLTGTYDFVFA